MGAAAGTGRTAVVVGGGGEGSEGHFGGVFFGVVDILPVVPVASLHRLMGWGGEGDGGGPGGATSWSFFFGKLAGLLEKSGKHRCLNGEEEEDEGNCRG